MELSDIRKGLEEAKLRAEMNEIACDMYYTSGLKKQDDENIKYWEDKLNERLSNASGRERVLEESCSTLRKTN